MGDLQQVGAALAHETEDFVVDVDANVNVDVTHQVPVRLELGVSRRALHLTELALVGEGLPNHRPRVGVWDPSSSRGHVRRVERLTVQVPQSAGQVRLGTIFGIAEQSFEVGFVGISVILFRNKSVIELDQHLLDHGVQEIIDGNDLPVVGEVFAVGRDDFEDELHVAL